MSMFHLDPNYGAPPTTRTVRRQTRFYFISCIGVLKLFIQFKIETKMVMGQFPTNLDVKIDVCWREFAFPQVDDVHGERWMVNVRQINVGHLDVPP